MILALLIAPLFASHFCSKTTNATKKVKSVLYLPLCFDQSLSAAVLFLNVAGRLLRSTHCMCERVADC